MSSNLKFYSNVRNVIVTSLSLASAFILYFIGYAGGKRDCQNGSAFPPDWKNDLTYQKPYHVDTFPTISAVVFVLLLIPLWAWKSPCMSKYCSKSNKSYSDWNDYLKFVFVVAVFYLVGAGISNGIVDILKGQLCSLRPYAALKPDEDDSYLSTPSGHTNIVVYTSVYVTYWLLKEFSDPIIKVGICMLMSVYPFVVGASRIIDNHHWPADVLAGAIIGCTVGWTVCYIIENLDCGKSVTRNSIITNDKDEEPAFSPQDA
mmetsp:Transcript_8808/g.8880  ORF Transcript_8808/g.8880 Transcript_8808/m.8880 type:complete len:260 (+) Transcript_8808:138-917(+)